MSVVIPDGAGDLVRPPSVAAAPRRGVVRQALAFRRTRVGLLLTLAIVLIAVVGPLFAPYGTTQLAGAPFSPPSGHYLLGTDFLGRDVLSRFLGGGQLILVEALGSVIVGVGGGALVGILAGYSRAVVDDVIMRALDVLLAFPQIVFALLVVSMFGADAWLVIIAVGLTHLPRTARVARAATAELAEREFVQSSEALGTPRWRIMVAEILPNISSPILVELGLRLTYSIGIIAGLDYLGLGVAPPKADWGLMINENRDGLTTQPWSVVAPVLAIALLTIGTNLVADGVSRALIGLDRGAGNA